MEAQEDALIHDKVKRNIVLLTANAEREDRTRLAEQRNGIIVSGAGWLLTTYGLIESFTDIKPGSLTITARGDATEGEDVRLAIIDFSEHLNLLFLALPASSEKYPHFVLSAEHAPTVDSKLSIYGSGTINFQSFADDTNVDAALRAIDIDDSGVLAGAPVYDQDGKLLGLVQDEQRADKNNESGGTGQGEGEAETLQGDTKAGQVSNHRILYTPIPYAVPLLITVRADDIFAALDTRLSETRADELEAALEELRHTVTFNPVIDATKGELLIYYDKMLAEPGIQFINVKVIAVNPPSETVVGPRDGIDMSAKTLEFNDPTRGWFDATDALFKVLKQTVEVILPATEAFKFLIVGQLEDGAPIPSVELERPARFYDETQGTSQ